MNHVITDQQAINGIVVFGEKEGKKRRKKQKDWGGSEGGRERRSRRQTSPSAFSIIGSWGCYPRRIQIF